MVEQKDSDRRRLRADKELIFLKFVPLLLAPVQSEVFLFCYIERATRRL